jgi:hypothetical protein
MNNDESLIIVHLSLVHPLKLIEFHHCSSIFSTAIKANKGFIIVHLSLVHPLNNDETFISFNGCTKDR